MTGRPRALLCAALLVGACSAVPGEEPTAEAGLCAFTVTRSNAWVDRMPRICENTAPPLTVMVRVTPGDRIRALERVSAGDGTLVLRVAPGEAPLQPGTMTWRMRAPDPLFERIEVRCDGETVARIGQIDTVY